MIRKEDAFLKEIDRISDTVIKNGKVDYDIKKFKEQFFYQSSHSPDNLESVEYVEYGELWNNVVNRRQFGLKVKEQNISITDIHYYIEGNDEVVSILLKEFPTLSRKEIEAAQRVITIILRGLELDEYRDD